MLGYRTCENPHGLVYPVCFHDGDHFPEEVKQIQHKDLRKWNRPSQGFLQTTDYHDFIGQMQAVAGEIAALLSVAPGWRDDFPVILPLGVHEPITLGVPRL